MPKTLPGCEVGVSLFKDVLGRLKRFMERFTPYLPRIDTAENAALVVEGLLSDLPRKTAEPIAEFHGVEPRRIQKFIGESPWDDDFVTEGLRAQVAAEWGAPTALLAIDPTTFPKQGDDSVGVARQWCGRLGKVENCQKGVFLSYVAPRGSVLVDRRLYLPEEEWANDAARRKKCHVPEEVEFRTSWQIAADLIERSKSMPHAFIVGDDEFGRASEFRDLLEEWGELYVLDVPANTLVRSRGGEWMRASDWAKSRGNGSWYRCHVRDGVRGPLYVNALVADVQTKRDGRIGPWERLLVLRSCEPKPEWRFCLSNAPRFIPISELVRAARGRHEIEDVFARGKGQVGLAQYEVRSWIGWHHHVTLSMLALWFLELERERLGGKNPGHHAAPGRVRRAASRPRSGRRSRGTRPEDHDASQSNRAGAA
jgi:SRSO17 transposase